jgi:hypothetical protein
LPSARRRTSSSQMCRQIMACSCWKLSFTPMAARRRSYNSRGE